MSDTLEGRLARLSLTPRLVAVVKALTSSPTPDESMVVTSLRLITTLVAPLLIASWTALRSATSPIPMVILPFKSRIVTPSLCRTLTFISCLSYLISRSRLPFAFGLVVPGEPLAQRHHGAAARPQTVLDVIHEALHVKDPAAIRLEQVLRRQGVLEVGGIEALPLVLHPDDQPVVVLALEGEIDVDLLGGVLQIAVLDGVGHRLANRHVDPMPVVVVQAELIQRVLEHQLNQLDVLETAPDGQVEALFVRHCRSPSREVYQIPPGAPGSAPASPASRPGAVAAAISDVSAATGASAGLAPGDGPISRIAMGMMTSSWTPSNRACAAMPGQIVCRQRTRKA